MNNTKITLLLSHFCIKKRDSVFIYILLFYQLNTKVETFFDLYATLDHKKKNIKAQYSVTEEEEKVNKFSRKLCQYQTGRVFCSD